MSEDDSQAWGCYGGYFDFTSTAYACRDALRGRQAR